MRIVAILTAALISGCFASKDETLGRVALISNAALENKVLTGMVPGRMLEGESCRPYSLSNAFEDAIEGTGYDTLVDVQVGARDEYIFVLNPMFFLSSSLGASDRDKCVYVRGRGVNSRMLPDKAESP